MTTILRRCLTATLSALVLAAADAALAQPPAPPPTTAVLVNLVIKTDADRSQVMTVLPDEVRDTVRLYLDGKIQQWFARVDGRGVMFIMNCSTVAEAKALMDGLPLAKAHLADFEFTPLGPLTPLRVLLGPPPAAPKP